MTNTTGGCPRIVAGAARLDANPSRVRRAARVKQSRKEGAWRREARRAERRHPIGNQLPDGKEHAAQDAPGTTPGDPPRQPPAPDSAETQHAPRAREPLPGMGIRPENVRDCS